MLQIELVGLENVALPTIHVIQSPQTCISTPLLGEKKKGGCSMAWSVWLRDGHFRGFRSRDTVRVGVADREEESQRRKKVLIKVKFFLEKRIFSSFRLLELSSAVVG